jgi:hypothetical protein
VKPHVQVRGCRRAGKVALQDYQLEFEGRRAFLVWDVVSVGTLLFKTRVELNPKLLRKLDVRGLGYYYRGKVRLPRPEHN